MAFCSVHSLKVLALVSSVLCKALVSGVLCNTRIVALLWRHNGRDGVSNHQTHDCLLNRWFRSLAFVLGIHRWPANSPHKGPVTQKMFPFDDVIIYSWCGNVRGMPDIIHKGIVASSRIAVYFVCGKFFHNQVRIMLGCMMTEQDLQLIPVSDEYLSVFVGLHFTNSWPRF